MLARRSYLQTVTHEDRIFAIGGSADGRALNTIEVFDPAENAWCYWFTMPPMQTKRTLHGSAVGQGRVYVCGGFDGMRDLNTLECYDPCTNAWQMKSAWNLEQGRSYLAMCSCQGKIYALGGQDRRRESGPRAHSSVEAFDLYSERWLPVAPLASGRLGLTASHLIHPDGEDFIYACGGSDGLDVLSSVECFNVTEANRFEAERQQIEADRERGKKELDAEKSKLAKSEAENKEAIERQIKVLQEDQASKEALRTERETALKQALLECTWSAAPSMSTPRLGHAAAVVNNRLYVIGGYDGKEPLDTFECFDPAIGKWSPPLKIGSGTLPIGEVVVTAPL